VTPRRGLTGLVARLVSRAPESEVLIVSYPKCGRTWLRLMLGTVLCRQFGLDEADVFATRSLSASASLRPTRFVHDGAGGVAGIPWDRQERVKSRFRGRSVVLLVRDPRDVIVSSYFQATRRMAAYRGALGEFVRDDCFGVRSVLAMYAAWEASRDLPQEFLLVRYEELHRDPGAVLRAVLAVMGVSEPDDAAVAAALAHGSFERMRARERAGDLEGRKLRPGDPSDLESYKVRRGVVGGYVDYLDPGDVAWIEARMREHGDPFGYLAG
jgi:hypothetical protein